MIQVRWNTHRQAKRQAKAKGIPMLDYIQNLLSDDAIRSSVVNEIEKENKDKNANPDK